MKLDDINKSIDLLKTLQNYLNGLEYNVSSYSNQILVKVLPILQDEKARLESSNVEINCPKIKIFTNQDAKNNKQTVEEYMNYCLRELVVNNYKIIEYGKIDEQYADDNTRIVYFFIKYTD